jgi:hypothetical protein
MATILTDLQGTEATDSALPRYMHEVIYSAPHLIRGTEPVACGRDIHRGEYPSVHLDPTSVFCCGEHAT